MLLMKPTLKFCSLSRSISSAQRKNDFFVHYLLAQGARLSSLYMSFMARDIAWMSQSTENEGKKKRQLKSCEPRRWRQLVLLSPKKNDSSLILFEMSTFDIPRPPHLWGYNKSNQNKTALSKKLLFSSTPFPFALLLSSTLSASEDFCFSFS